MSEDTRPLWVRIWEDIPMTERERMALLEAAKSTPKIVERLRRRKLLDGTPRIEPPDDDPEGRQ